MNINDLEDMVINGGYDVNILFDDGRDAFFTLTINDGAFTVNPRGMTILNDGGYMLLNTSGQLFIEGMVQDDNVWKKTPSVIRGLSAEKLIEELSSSAAEGIMQILDEAGEDYEPNVYEEVFSQMWEEFEGDMIFEITDEYSD